MKKYFVCLANSKKYSQRCVAGVEVEQINEGFRLVRQNGEPKWIRPVTRAEHGEVPNELVDHLKLLDIVEVEVTGACSSSYQSENVLFNHFSLKTVRQIHNIESAIPQMLTKKTGYLFGNKGKAVSTEEIKKLDYSLILIKPENVRISLTTNLKPRAGFKYQGINYVFPVTDLDFLNNYVQNKDVLLSCENIFFTISLGIEFEDWHYKLVAGIVYF